VLPLGSSCCFKVSRHAASYNARVAESWGAARDRADRISALSPLLASLHLVLCAALHAHTLHGCVVPRQGDACSSMGSHAAWVNRPCMAMRAATVVHTPSPKWPSLWRSHVNETWLTLLLPNKRCKRLSARAFQHTK
jgi:hypothetical protein